MLSSVRATSVAVKPASAKPVAVAQQAEAPVAASRAFKPQPVAAQAKQVTFTLPTIPQAVGGTLAGVLTAGASFMVSLGMGMGGAGAIANWVGVGGLFVAAPLAAYFGGKLAGAAWEAMTKK